jgi:acyl carrier protein
MNKEEIKSTIRELITDIAEDMDIDESSITDDASFIEDWTGFNGTAGSAGYHEKKFGVSIPVSEFPNITSINKCVTTVEKYLSQKS